MKNAYINCDSNLYIAIKACGIHPLALAIDGVRMHKFPRLSNFYVLLNDAIVWYEKEIPRTSGKKKPRRLDY